MITHRLDAIASKTQAFTATLKGLDTFPRTGHVEVIWADLDEGASLIKSLMRETAESLKDITPQDSSKARQPHVTLARVKSGGNSALRKYVEANQDRTFGSMQVNSLHVYQSQLTQEGAKYRVLRSFGLDE